MDFGFRRDLARNLQPLGPSKRVLGRFPFEPAPVTQAGDETGACMANTIVPLFVAGLAAR